MMISGTCMTMRSASDGDAIGFSQRRAGRDEDVDREAAFVERRQELATEERHRRQRHENDEGEGAEHEIRSAEADGEHTRFERLDAADQPRIRRRASSVSCSAADRSKGPA